MLELLESRLELDDDTMKDDELLDDWELEAPAIDSLPHTANSCAHNAPTVESSPTPT